MKKRHRSEIHRTEPDSKPLDNEYHDPDLLGSLSGALRIWQSVRDANTQCTRHHVRFAFSCQGETRALRVARFLRRRVACALITVNEHALSGQWHVDGSTHDEIHTLLGLEQLSISLRTAARNHQVRLTRLTLTQAIN